VCLFYIFIFLSRSAQKEELRTELAIEQLALATDPDGPHTVEDSHRLVRAQV
jgi:hypothetical protein